MPEPRTLFVTGRLAEPALRRVVDQLGVPSDIAVLPISVAALLTTTWVASHLKPPPNIDRIVLPGYCRGELEPVAEAIGLPVERGPKDLQDLHEHLGRTAAPKPKLDMRNLEIIAEINLAPRMHLQDVLERARRYRSDGADVIDLGCDPAECWHHVGDAVKALRDDGFRVSIDSLNPEEIALAVRAGAELVLSVNSSNVHAAGDWGAEVVVIPDDPATLAGFDATIERLTAKNVPSRLDPIIEPIGFGFAASLGRYLSVRQRYPDAEMMMGVGNLTELTEVDSAGINVLLAGFCEELRIRTVLTTEVANWCRSSVRELDMAGRLMATALRNRTLPKGMTDDLLTLRDRKLKQHPDAGLAELAAMVKDPNFRIFAEAGELHAMNNSLYVRGLDPFQLFAEMSKRGDPIAPDHAFYLGYELCKAMTALTLGKNYQQDQPLRWGLAENPADPSNGGP